MQSGASPLSSLIQTMRPDRGANGAVCYTANGHWRPSFPGQTCSHCGATYVAHRKGQKFCGNECKALSRRNTVAHTCEVCASTFEALEAENRKTCSRKCGYELIRSRSAEKRKRACVICGAGFTVRSADRVGLTCSKVDD